MSNLRKCPECGTEDSVEYSQNADILFRIDGDSLVPVLDFNAVGFLDQTYLYCRHCGTNDADSQKMLDLLYKYDKLMIREGV